MFAEEHSTAPIINFDKRRRVAAVIVDLINFQRKPFPFEQQPKVRDLIEATRATTEREMGEGTSSECLRALDERLYQQSLECEPRGTGTTASTARSYMPSFFGLGGGSSSSTLSSSSSTPQASSSSGGGLFSSSSFTSTIRGFFGSDSRQ